MRAHESREKLFTIPRSEFRVETMRGSGPGGQHRNKTASCVRITHIPSGVAVYECSEKSQYTNKRVALERLRDDPKFRLHVLKRVLELRQEKSVEERVDEMLAPDNLVFEVQEEGRWVPWRDEASEAGEDTTR